MSRRVRGAVASVLSEKELLERRFPAQELAYPGGGENLQQRLDRPSHLAAENVPDNLDRRHTGELGDLGHGTFERRFNGESRKVSHLRQCPHLDQQALAQDSDPIAERLDLAQDVRGQEDCLAPLARLMDAKTKGLFHERVEPARRLVEYEQPRCLVLNKGSM